MTYVPWEEPFNVMLLKVVMIGDTSSKNQTATGRMRSTRTEDGLSTRCRNPPSISVKAKGRKITPVALLK
jgi:hypothetical protein